MEKNISKASIAGLKAAMAHFQAKAKEDGIRLPHSKGISALAEAMSQYTICPVSRQRIWTWLHRDGKVPASMCLPIERATEGAVLCEQLRPDCFPDRSKP